MLFNETGRIYELSGHEPLISLINTQDLCKTLIRCQTLLMQLRRCNLKVEHVPGNKLIVSDNLHPIEDENNTTENYVNPCVDSVLETLPTSDKMEQIKIKTGVMTLKIISATVLNKT